MKRAFIVILVLGLSLMIAAGCGNDKAEETVPVIPTIPDAEDAPDLEPETVMPEAGPVAGFTRIMSMREDGYTVTQYMGAGTTGQALEAFTVWAENEGWTLSSEAYFDIPYDAGMEGMAAVSGGRLFEKGNEGMSISAIDAAGQVYVIVGTGPIEDF